MKLIWLVLLALSLGCAAVGKVADNLSSPGEPARQTAEFVDSTLHAVPGPGGVDLGSLGIGGAVVSALGLIAKLMGTNKRIDKTKAELDALYDEVRPAPAKAT